MLLLTLAVTLGCGPKAPPVEVVDAIAPAASIERRPYAVVVDGAPVLAGISYGPHRAGQRPGGPDPSPEQLR